MKRIRLGYPLRQSVQSAPEIRCPSPLVERWLCVTVHDLLRKDGGQRIAVTDEADWARSIHSANPFNPLPESVDRNPLTEAF